MYTYSPESQTSHRKSMGGHTTNHTLNAYTQESHQSLYPISKTNSTNSKKQWKIKKATPIFCTITRSMNIKLYNEYLLKTHKTHTLHHTANYHKMQPLIDNIICQVNYYIIRKNIANKVSTPYFHSVIRTKKGNKRKHSKFFYTDDWGGLSDGVHGTYDTRLKHSTENRGSNNKRKHSTDNRSSDDEIHSPKGHGGGNGHYHTQTNPYC